MNQTYSDYIALAAIFVCTSLLTSIYLIYKHQSNLSRLSIQPKIVGILWMVPIYGVISFISLVVPPYALYLDMLRDCYEAYVLYLFLALMLSYLNADEDEYAIISYLNKHGPFFLPRPLYFCFPAQLPQGKEFLRYCKFGTLQYCVIKPLATFIAIILDSFNLYHESNFSPAYGFLYITIAVNTSIFYAFMILASFYTCLKAKLKPFQPIGKFLCIKFVVFFAFWQGVIIALLVRFDVIKSIDSYYSAERLSRSLQNFLICFEMMLVSFAHLYTFSYRPFTPKGQYEQFMIGKSFRRTRQRFNIMEHAYGENEAVIAGAADADDETEDILNNASSNRGNEITGGGYVPPVIPSARHLVASSTSSSSSSSSSSSLYASKNSSVPPEEWKVYEDNPHLQAQTNKSSVGGAYSNRQQLQQQRSRPINSTRFSSSSSSARTSGHDSSGGVRLSTNSQLRMSSYSDSDQSQKSTIQSISNTVNAAWTSITEVVNRNFASSTAVRDFNETMPVVLPSGFAPSKGVVLESDPQQRMNRER